MYAQNHSIRYLTAAHLFGAPIKQALSVEVRKKLIYFCSFFYNQYQCNIIVFLAFAVIMFIQYIFFFAFFVVIFAALWDFRIELSAHKNRNAAITVGSVRCCSCWLLKMQIFVIFIKDCMTWFFVVGFYFAYHIKLYSPSIDLLLYIILN